MKCPHWAIACFLFAISTSSNATLMFSEYVEGSSYNKALELFNSEATSNIALDEYAIDIYVNGATSPRYTINLSGMLEAQGTFVIGNASADADITAVADMLSGSLSFNGDDAITLVQNGVIVDRIGQIGVDPGTEWGTGLTSTQDNTLRRNTDIVTGDINALAAFDPVTQWQGFAQDDFSNLGNHNVSAIVLPLPSEDSTAVPLPGSGALILMGLLPLMLNGVMRPRRSAGPVAA